jgi:putative MATE family efflux protein
MSEMDGAIEPRHGAGYWLGVVGDALRGRTGDLARGPLGTAIVLLAVPMVLEMLMESVFAVVDIFFVSRLGADAVAAVGLTESFLGLIYTVAAGLSIGVTAIVARRTGEGDTEGAAVATIQAVVIAVVLSTLLGVAGVLGAPTLLRVMGAGDDVVRIGTGYAAVSLGGSVVILLLFLLNAAFRGAGDAAVAMRVLWLANGINIVLDPLLIFGIGPFPELGVTGAAVASVIGRGTGVALQLYILLRADGRLRVALRHLRIRIGIMARVLRLSGTGMLQSFINMASWIAAIRIISGFGSEAVAGYVIAIRMVLFVLLPAWGLGNAAATLVGQGLGAGDSERAEGAVWVAARMNLGFLGAIAMVFLLFAPELTGIFGGDAITQIHAVRGLRILSICLFPYAFGMVVTQSFNGAGAAWTPTLLNLLCFWLWQIPLGWFLAHHLELGPSGVYIALTSAFTAISVLSTVIFRRGAWKRAVV